MYYSQIATSSGPYQRVIADKPLPPPQHSMTHSYDKTQTLPAAAGAGARVGGLTADRTRSEADALRAGYQVGSWRIEQTLALGPADILYLAHDDSLQSTVLLQEFFPAAHALREADGSVQIRCSDDLAPFEDGLECMAIEAEKLATLQHDHLATAQRHERCNGSLYVAIRYENGDPLVRWRARQPPLDRPALLKMVCPLLQGLGALHGAGLLHPGLAPDAVHVGVDDSPLLLTPASAHRGAGLHTPGFAAPERCGSGQAVGPWTDVYAIGALMYWLATGTTPTESGARLRGDMLARATQTANRLVYGEPLLQAIDQALEMDISRRPQTAAELLKTLDAMDLSRTQSMSALRTVVATPPPQQGSASAAEEASHRTRLGTLMALYVVNPETGHPAQQLATRALLRDCVNAVTQALPPSSYLAVDSPGGMTLCFLEDPEDALEAALRLRELLEQSGHALALRIGLHLGPVRLLAVSDGPRQVLGDGLNVAQRITEFARPNQIVMTRALHDLIHQLSDNVQGLFRELGAHMDKHLRAHHIYEVLDPRHRPAAAPVAISGFERTASFAALASLTPEVVQTIETELLRAIGPVASTLVKKALLRTWTEDGLRKLLAVAIPDAASRQAFARAGKPADT